MYKIVYVILLSCILMMLTACSIFKPVQDTPSSTFLLTASELNIPTAKPSQLTLLVGQPKAIQAYNTKRMAYVGKPYELAYFSENRWADTPVEMLQPLIVQAMQNTKHFRAVVAAPFVGRNDILLNTQLLQLQQEFLQHPSQVRLALRAQLIDSSKRTVIATKLFTIIVPAQQDTPYGGVVAANQAVAELLKQLTSFCVAETLASPK